MDPIESLRQTAAAAGLLPNEDPAIQRLRQTALSAGLLGSRQEDDEPLRKLESTLLKSGTAVPRPDIDLSTPGDLYGEISSRLGLNARSFNTAAADRYALLKFAPIERAESVHPSVASVIRDQNSGDSDAAKKSRQRWHNAGVLGYLIEKTPANPRERLTADDELINIWLNATHRKLFESYGGEYKREILDAPLKPLPPDFRPAELQEASVKFLGTGRDWFTPRESAIWDAARGDDMVKFLDSRRASTVARHRLEIITGRPHPLNIPKHLIIDNDLNSPDNFTTPRDLGFSPLWLASRDPSLRQLANVQAAYDQGEQYGQAAFAQLPFMSRSSGDPIADFIGGDVADLAHKATYGLLAAPRTEGEAQEIRRIAGSTVKDVVQTPLNMISLPIYYAANTIAAPFEFTGKHIGQALAGPPPPTEAPATPLSWSWRDITYNAAAKLSSLLWPDVDNDYAAAGRLLDSFHIEGVGERAAGMKNLITADRLTKRVLKNLFYTRDSANGRAFAEHIVEPWIPNSPEEVLFEDVFIPSSNALAAPVVDDTVNTIALALGLRVGGKTLAARAVGSAAAAAKSIATPLTRYSKFADLGANTAAADAAHGSFIRLVNKELGKLDDPTAAAEVLKRAQSVWESAGPIDGVDTSGILTKLSDLNKDLHALGGAVLRPESRAALLDAVKQTARIGPTEALYTATGKFRFINDAETLRFTEKLSRLSEKIDQTYTVPEEFRAVLSDAEFDGLASALVEHQTKTSTAVAAHARLTEMVSTYRDTLLARNNANHPQLFNLQSIRKQLVAEHNLEIARALERRDHLDKIGGYEILPNPNLKSKLHEHVADTIFLGDKSALTQIAFEKGTLEKVIADPATIKEIREALQIAPESVATFRREGVWTYTETPFTPEGQVAIEALARRQSQAYHTLRTELEAWYNETTQPLKREIKPYDTAERAKLRASIRAKLSDKSALGAPAKLTDTELALLNENRATPIDATRASDLLKSLDSDIDTLTKLIKSDTDKFLLADAQLPILQKTEVKPGVTISLPKQLAKDLQRELATSSALIRNDRYVPLSDSITGRSLSALEAFDELRDKLSADVRAMNAGLKVFKKWDASILLRSGRNDFLYAFNKFHRAAQDAETLILDNARRIAKIIDRELTPEESLAIFAERNEKGFSSLKPEVQKLIEDSIEQTTEALFNLGGLTKEQFYGWLGDRKHYTHHAYLQDNPYHLPGRWKNLRLDESFEQFKPPDPIRDGPIYVAWKNANTGRINYKKGFQSPEAARAWLEGNRLLDTGGVLPEGTPIKILNAEPLASRVIRGLVADPAISYLDLMQKMAHRVGHQHLTRTFARTPFVLSDAQFNLNHLTRATETTANDAAGARWYKINNSDLGELHNKWVHEDILKTVQFYSTGWEAWNKFWGASADLINASELQRAVTAPTSNPFIGRFTEIMTRALGGYAKATAYLKWPRNLLAFTKVAISPLSYINQWGSNFFFNMPAMGFEVLDPLNWPFFLKSLHEGRKAFFELTSKDALLRDPYMKELYDGGFISLSRSRFYALKDDLLRKYASDASALEARLDFFKTKAADALNAGSHDLHGQYQAEIAQLSTQLDALRSSQMSGVFGDLYNGFKYAVAETAKASVGKGRWNDYLWDQFSLPDVVTKYIAYRYLREKRGMSPDAALSRVDAFGQNLHRVPEWIKQLSSRSGGSQFVSYPASQIRSWFNVLLKRPLWFTSRMAAMSAFNYASMAGDGRNPEDVMNAWSFLKFRQPRNALTDLAYLTSRAYLPGGYALSANTLGMDVFEPQSVIGRQVEKTLFRTDGSLLWKLPANVANALVSKFALGGVELSLISRAMNGTDLQGRPYANIGHMAADLTTTFLPSVVKDASFAYDIGTNTKIDYLTGRAKSWTDFAARAFKLIPPSDWSEAALIKSGIENQISGRDGGIKRFIADSNESFRDFVHTRPYYRDGKITDRAAFLADAVQWSKDHAHVWSSPFVDVESRSFPTAERLKSLINSATSTGLQDLIRRSSLSESLLGYLNARIAGGRTVFDPEVDRAVRLNIMQKASAQGASAADKASLLPVIQSLPLSADDKNFAFGILAK